MSSNWWNSREPNRYLAGLWQDSLVNDLLWRVIEPLQGRGEDRPRDHQPPTWSWASVNGRVAHWPEHLSGEHFQVTTAATDVAPYTDCFGESTGGRISVIGHLRPATLRHNLTVAGCSTERVSWQFSQDFPGKSVRILPTTASPSQGSDTSKTTTWSFVSEISSARRSASRW